MARITVEDCLKHVNNRFDLVLKAADRARRLLDGSAEPHEGIMWKNDKATVVALREIAAGYLKEQPIAKKATGTTEQDEQLAAAFAEEFNAENLSNVAGNNKDLNN